VVSCWTEVGFETGWWGGARTCRFCRAGDDGRDIGADLAAIAAAQKGGRGSDGCGVGIAVPK